jgi:MerR family transcriptional regulator, thiopeptide resistance regulator
LGWSTSELAALAGTTVKAVRHYHGIGLLAEPARASNGYKQYQTAHLVRLIQIRRLIDLGMPLARIAELDLAATDPGEAIRALDGELESQVERLQAIRLELAGLLARGQRLETPPVIAAAHPDTSEKSRALAIVYASVGGAEVLRELRDALAHHSPAEADLDSLPDDADAAQIEALARRIAPEILGQQERYPALSDPLATSPRMRDARETIGRAIVDLYSVAQLRVMIRADELVREARAADAVQTEDFST